MWLRLRLTACPPFSPAWRASDDENSWAVPRWCAARPPAAAIARWRASLIPANPLPLLEDLRERELRPVEGRLFEAAREVARDRAEVERRDRVADVRADRADLFELRFLPLDRCALVSPFSRRILLTVRAATSSARPP